MKKIGVLLPGLFLVLVGMFVITGCSEDTTTNDGPQITFANGIDEVTLQKGVTQWEINATITSAANLDEVVLFEVGTGYEDQLGEAITSFQDKTSYDLKFTVSNITEDKVIKITATDKDDITNSKFFTINVTPNDPPPPTDELLFWTGTMAAQLGAQGSALGSSFATSTGAVYTKSPAATNSSIIDFIYYYNGTDAEIKAEIISPKFAADHGNVVGANSWSVKNETQFVLINMTAAEFDAIVATDDSPVVAAASGFTDQRVVNLAVGDVFAFQTTPGKLGVAKVTALSGTTDGSITIEVKVQK